MSEAILPTGPAAMLCAAMLAYRAIASVIPKPVPAQPVTLARIDAEALRDVAHWQGAATGPRPYFWRRASMVTLTTCGYVAGSEKGPWTITEAGKAAAKALKP